MTTTRTGAAVPAALAGGLVVLAVLGAALAGPLDLRTVGRDGTGPDLRATAPPVSQPPLPTSSVQGPPPVPGATEIAPWILVVVGLVVVGLLVAALVAALRRLVESRGATPPEDDRVVAPGEDPGGSVDDEALAVLREGVRAATRELDDDVPPGDAVVAAWVAVERAAAATGVERDRAQTATELALAVLGATRADPGSTRELLGLYLAARYGAEPVSGPDVARARALLAVVAQGLAARQDAPARVGPDVTPPDVPRTDVPRTDVTSADVPRTDDGPLP